MQRLSLIKAISIASILFAAFFYGSSQADEKNIHQVKDLAYGVSLFHFFQDKNFSAITDLLVAEHYQQIKSKDKNPQLLLGGLYLSYDLQQQSAEIFKQLLNDKTLNVSAVIQDRAWYLLGKNYYQNKNLELAKSAFEKIKDSLQAEDEAERLYLLNTIYLHSNNLASAEKTLNTISDNSVWKNYAQFNTASYSVRKGESTELGKKLFKQLANNELLNSETQTIKDKANLALAYIALQNKQSQTAIQHFNKIRLKETETNKALIGLGWAYYREKQYEEAIIPWLNLASSQTESDLAVQEALISIPYAFEKMQQKDKALYQYELAIDSYKFQLDETKKLYRYINGQTFIQEMNPGSLGSEATPILSIIKNINPLMTRYLLPLLTSDEFQHGIKSYQEISHLKYILSHWENNIPALRMILKEKRQTYQHKLAKTLTDKSLNKVKTLSQRYKQLSKELIDIESKQDAFKLTTSKEQSQLKLLKRSAERLALLKNTTEDSTEQQARLKRLKGLLTWNIITDYPVRIWQSKKQLRQLKSATQGMHKAMSSLKYSWAKSPADFSTFDKRIANKESQIRTLIKKLESAIKSQEKYLRSMALAELKLHRNQIKLYHDRALYAKARLYDSLMARE